MEIIDKTDCKPNTKNHLWELWKGGASNCGYDKQNNNKVLNPLFALDIFICSFRKCIQYTTRGQSKFSLSKLCCCYIFIVLKYWWQNSITAHIYANCDQGLVTRWVTRWVKMVQKEGKRSFEGFRGIIILLILAKVQSLSLGQALHLGQACQLPGHHSALW